MFCYHCGQANPDIGKFCQFCGKQLLRPPASSPETIVAQRVQQELEQVQQITLTPVPLDRCHRCSALNDLERIPFALGKEISSERDYGAMGASAAASAVTLALFGMGAIARPQSKTTYRLIRLETVLCPMCKKAFTDWAGDIKRGAYGFHPWYSAVMQLGYSAVIVGNKVVE